MNVKKSVLEAAAILRIYIQPSGGLGSVREQLLDQTRAHFAFESNTRKWYSNVFTEDLTFHWVT